jgi:catechol 2,3-dioxygenase-like lactoylglutathione lyase family enzyme
MTFQYTGYLTFLGTNNLELTRAYYEDILGFTFLGEEMGALRFTMGDISLRISVVEHFSPQSFTVLGWQVSDIEAAATHIMQAGIQPILYSFLPQDDLGIATLGQDRVLWFHDPAGNILSFTQA